ncbi:response regulator receiver domain-containing protein [Mumia flava]|uniref:Response regulator receiver domain-containing protein n=1 Tax=Mumia flava TaxID=1348852 RepID=A0A0B2BN46_9ACTN|nr:response regulator [Mumia flava]PJJ56470.1 response regulator receiver domain-containing protein [Mumia flava]
MASHVSPPPRVLVVDDTDSIRLLMRTNFELEGWTVLEAADGLECLDVVVDTRPDLITIDVVMPRMDGLDTIRALRSNPHTHDIPVVVVTTQAQAYDLQRGRDLGVEAYVTKPFDPCDLVATVREVLELSRASAS